MHSKEGVEHELQYSEYDDRYITEQDEAAKQQLVSLLESKRAVLMVGAGSSKFVGYPLWDELVEEMARQLAPSLKKPEDIDPDVYADSIRDHLRAQRRIEDYHNFLEKTFEPRRNASNPDDFHLALVKRLRFCGLITTNYDMVLETAVMKAYANENSPFLCEPIDLCHERPYLVLDFLRNLSLAREPRFVLHLHGYFRNPELLILTRTDYLAKYGELKFDGDGNPMNRVLDSLHRKVIWSLLVMYPLVFVGFSMKDPFFMQMLQIVQFDFKRGSDPLHFAILPFTAKDDKERALDQLGRRGITPVFYNVPRPHSPNDSPDHRSLKTLVFELAELGGTSDGPSDMMALTKRMLER